MDNIALRSETLVCEFSRENGALVRLIAAGTDWRVLDRPELGLSFQLLVPLNDELRNNPVLGEKQKLDSYEERTGRVIFRWKNVVSERGGALPVDVELTVAAEGPQIVYYMTIANRSGYVVESAHCPYLGDVRPPEAAAWLRSFLYNYGTGEEHDIWPHFHNLHGYYGVDYPTQMTGGCRMTPMTPFYLIRSENQGLYAGIKSENAASAAPVGWAVELRPGWGSSIDASVPEGPEIAGKPVHTRFAAVHMPYIAPGGTRSLVPVALEAFEGGWQRGADIYKAWRAGWRKPAEAPEWAGNPHSWQQLHINSPEDELRMRFTELPEAARECKKHGVAAIQLVGWNDGGQDQGNPSHDPDPRLGTFGELKAAIAECHRIGVKIILFSKFTWADKATERFRTSLKDLAATDPYGDYYHYGGYQYQTPAQLMDINTKRLVPMCFLSEEYLGVCEKEFRKVVDLGAAGMLYDECQHHSPAVVCFNTAHGHAYGAPVYQNDRELIKRFRRTPGIPADFLMSGEACYDWEMEAYQLAYFRTENKRHVPLSRYLWPQAQYMTAVTGFDDRNMINQCLMYRYIVSYEPYFFKGRLDDYPATMAYGETMDALRTKYRKWFWDGEFRDVCGARASFAGGGDYPTYSVFRASDGSLGAVVVNYEDEAVSVTLEAENGQKFGRYCPVGGGEAEFGGSVDIPARSAVVVMP